MIAGRSALLFAAAVIVSALGCRSDDAPQAAGGAQARAGSLPAGVVARVGSADVYAASVGRIAAAQGLDVERARDVAVREALFASEARARGLDSDPSVRSAIEAALARLLLRDLFVEAKRAGPVTDDELHDATQFYWLDMDRPPGFRTAHAVVRLDAKAAAAQRRDALAVAEAIHRALEPIAAQGVSSSAPAAPLAAADGSSDPSRAAPGDPLVESFKQAASAVPHDGFDVTIELLPPIAADGRVLEPGGLTFDPDFARAAASLVRRGDISSATTSRFGVHVIMLLERLPPHVVPPGERRARVQDEVITARARAAERALLERARDVSVVDRSVDAVLALVPVDR